MNLLLTASGKTFPCDFFGVAGVGVLIADIETDLITAANIFSDKKETSIITYRYDNDGEVSERIIKGFTAMVSLSPLYGDKSGIRIALQRQFVDVEG